MLVNLSSSMLTPLSNAFVHTNTLFLNVLVLMTLPNLLLSVPDVIIEH